MNKKLTRINTLHRRLLFVGLLSLLSISTGSHYVKAASFRLDSPLFFIFYNAAGGNNFNANYVSPNPPGSPINIGIETYNHPESEIWTVYIQNPIQTATENTSATVYPTVPTTYSFDFRHGAIGGPPTYPYHLNVTFAPPAPTASIYASPSTITVPSSTTLYYSCTNSTSAYIDNGVGAVSPTASPGTVVVTPGSTTTYTLTCSGAGVSTSAQTTVTVNPAPTPTAALSANPVSILSGDTSTLTWSSTNATSCTGSGFSTGSATSGSAPVTPSSTTGYSVTCYGAGGPSAPASATVNVTPKQANLYNSVGAGANITAGQSVTFSATTGNNGNGAASAFYDLFLVYDSTYNYTYANDSTYYAYVSSPVTVWEPSLGSGSTVTESASYSFNHAGTYYYRMYNDWYGAGNVAESNEGDNWSNNGFAQVTVHPTQPTSQTANCSVDGTHVTLSWDPNAGAANGYDVRFTPSPWTGGPVANQNDDFGATSVTYPSTPGTTYQWWVHTAYSSDYSNISDYTFHYITCAGIPPPPPTGLNYTCNAAGTAVTLSWNPTAGATFYDPRLYDGISPPFPPYNILGYADITDNYPSTSITYTNVVPNRLYSWWVHAGNASGISSQTYGTSFTCAGLPDLTATTNPPPANVIAGDATTYTGAVNNVGVAPAAGGFNTYIVFYSDAAGTTHLVPYPNYVAYAGYGPALSPGATSPISASYTINTVGTAYYRFCTDWDNAIVETNESTYDNPPYVNCGAMQQVNVVPPAPTGLSYACNTAGNQITLTWNAAPGASSYYVRSYDGVMSNPYPGYNGYTDFYTGTSITYPITPNVPASGWVHSIASNGSYNTAPATIGYTCASEPNLEASVGADQTVPVNQSHAYNASIINYGTASTGTGFTNLLQVCSPEVLVTGNCDDFYRSATVGIGALGPGGASSPVSASLVVDTPGTYLYRFCADLDGVTSGTIAESDEGDNCAPWANLTVTSPTLSCSANATTVNVGDTVTYTVTPNGGATTPYQWSDSRPVYSGSTNSSSFSITYSDPQNDSGTHQAQVKGSNTGYAMCPFVTVNGGYCTSATPALSIQALPNRVKSGGTTNLTWSASGINGVGKYCTVTGDNGYHFIPDPSVGLPPTCSIPSGSDISTITKKTVFTLYCGPGLSTSTVVNIIPNFKEF